MQFKQNIADEFGRSETSPWLRLVLVTIGAYVEYILGKQMVVTDILRDPLVQLQWCRSGGYKSGFRHCIGEAADIRSRNFTQEEQDKLLIFVNSTLMRFCRLQFHSQGTAPHFHVELIGECHKGDVLHAAVKNAQAEEWFAG